MLVSYLYTQQVNKLFIQLNNQKIFESQIHEVFFDYYFEGEGAWVTGRVLSLKKQCHISRIFFFPFFLPFYKLSYGFSRIKTYKLHYFYLILHSETTDHGEITVTTTFTSGLDLCIFPCFKYIVYQINSFALIAK